MLLETRPARAIAVLGFALLVGCNAPATAPQPVEAGKSGYHVQQSGFRLRVSQMCRRACARRYDDLDRISACWRACVRGIDQPVGDLPHGPWDSDVFPTPRPRVELPRWLD